MRLDTFCVTLLQQCQGMSGFQLASFSRSQQLKHRYLDYLREKKLRQQEDKSLLTLICKTLMVVSVHIFF